MTTRLDSPPTLKSYLLLLFFFLGLVIFLFDKHVKFIMQFTLLKTDVKACSYECIFKDLKVEYKKMTKENAKRETKQKKKEKEKRVYTN